MKSDKPLLRKPTFIEYRVGDSSRQHKIRLLARGRTWKSIETSLKTQYCDGADIKCILYMDTYGDMVTVQDSRELEYAIFHESVKEFTVELHDIVITFSAQMHKAQRRHPFGFCFGFGSPISLKRASAPVPSIPVCAENRDMHIGFKTLSFPPTSKEVNSRIRHSVEGFYPNVEIYRVQYQDQSQNTIHLHYNDEVTDAVFNKDVRSFHVLFSTRSNAAKLMEKWMIPVLVVFVSVIFQCLASFSFRKGV